MTSLPFGDNQAITSTCTDAPDVSPRHFTGKERDTESNLDYFGARYYSSTQGRFMSPDWAARPTAIPYLVFGDPQSLNLYAYVRNNSLNRTDPDGHYEVSASGCGQDNKKCQKKYDKRIDNFEKARKRDLKSKDPNVRAAAASYGARGDANGVHVGVTNLGPGIKGSVDDKSGFGKTDVEVKINSNLEGKSLRETVAHEGSHVEDDQKYDDSPMNEFGNHDPSLNLTHGQTEFNAYKTGAGVDREHGFGPNDDQKIRDFIKNDPNYAPIIDDPTHNPED
jgi:RHS repeat-associated protein